MISVIMYKCEALAATCGECLSLDSALQCGWCEGMCTTMSQCQQNWLSRKEICSNVQIDSVSRFRRLTQNGFTESFGPCQHVLFHWAKTFRFYFL